MNYHYPAYPTAQASNNFINCVLDFDSKLYIGDAQAFQNYQNYDVKAIISFSTEQNFQANSDADQMVLQVNDRPQCDISGYFDKTNKFINKHMDDNHNVLVHCMAGKSRSATIVLAYLMFSQDWTLQEALIYLKSVRPLVCPNPGFIRQLLKYEEKLFGKVKSNLTHEITPYYNVQKADTIIPEGPAVGRNYMSDQNAYSRRSSFVSPPSQLMGHQRSYQQFQYGWRYY
ncbi:unnamed protein product [Paramecium octaurelia]|uniref:Protein-tyrosine-phosphatase n=1 Tax=Paramecium octaurelia TaxID=43137 RepID=A0A8S1VWS8_PAROT|nr:unnamed protein product [Paramecium octaurelia]